jgi:ketosteroid isomerase-like protein
MIATGVAGITAAAFSKAGAATPDAANPELEQVGKLLKAHDTAMTGHDLDGVLATFADDAAVMGTGPGEMWSGKEELKVAYGHFFMPFDKGEQQFEYNFWHGDLAADMGWAMTSGTVKGKKDGKEFTYPLNISLTVVKKGGEWKIAAMHFSTLAGKEGA